MFKEIDLSVFPPERKEKLQNIYRYNYYDVLIYRSDLWRHSYRVLWLLESIIPLAQKHIQFDAEKARTLALVHDDVEMVTGDVQAILKARMTPEELDALGNQEFEAIEELAKRYPKEINGYSYRELLHHAAKKDCIEAQLVSYVDKVDAYCESLHEVYAGNMSMLRAVVFYARTIPAFPTKYPELASLLLEKSPLTYLGDLFSPFKIEVQDYMNLGKLHTEESLEINTDFPFYKEWKRIVIEKGKVDWLLEQREHLPQN